MGGGGGGGHLRHIARRWVWGRAGKIDRWSWPSEYCPPRPSRYRLVRTGQDMTTQVRMRVRTDESLDRTGQDMHLLDVPNSCTRAMWKLMAM